MRQDSGAKIVELRLGSGMCNGSVMSSVRKHKTNSENGLDCQLFIPLPALPLTPLPFSIPLSPFVFVCVKCQHLLGGNTNCICGHLGTHTHNTLRTKRAYININLVKLLAVRKRQKKRTNKFGMYI